MFRVRNSGALPCRKVFSPDSHFCSSFSSSSSLSKEGSSMQPVDFYSSWGLIASAMQEPISSRASGAFGFYDC